MKRFFLLTAVTALLSGSISFSQARIENRLKFHVAEADILYEEYQEALKGYLELIKSYPTNSNLQYRIGQCYINIPAEKQKALGYLKEAVLNINPKYKEGKFREKGAPHDAYYYLANAYRINNQLDEALETYNLFNKNLNQKIYDTSVVNLQIRSCLNAGELMKKPLYVKKENLGQLINDQYPDLNPVVSADQKSMVYNKLTPFQEMLYYVRKSGDKWGEPINIITDLGLGQESGNFATSLSDDGKELYIYRRELDYDGNIYVTRKLEGDRWSNITKLNDNINTKYWESHATVSHDGKKLYFASNRKGSIGGLDIYVSERDSGDAWGPARNLGPVINTKYNEDTPFLSEDDRTLFFSSVGHYNMGGYDIFYSTLGDNREWSAPVNAGYPLNTTDDDIFFHPVGSGHQAYYSMIAENGYGLADIYRVEIFSDKNPRKLVIKGIAKIADLSAAGPDDKISIAASSMRDPGKTTATYTDPETGEYLFVTDHGDYEVLFESPFSEKVLRNMNFPLLSPSDTIIVPDVILPKTDLVADLNVVTDKTTRDSVWYRITTEPRSRLTVERWTGDSLVSSENFVTGDAGIIYKMARADIDSVAFRLTDRFGNIAAEGVPVERMIITKPVVRPVYERITAEEKPAEEIIVRKDTAATVTEVIPEPEAAATPEKKCKLWYLWVILGGAGLLIIFLLFRRKARKSEKDQ